MSERIKVLLHDQGEDPETTWAEDLGPSGVAPGARRVRLANVPFLHAKPTWGDVIVVIPNADGFLAWDRRGVSWEDLDERIEEDSGRWVMIVSYDPAVYRERREQFIELMRWLDARDFIAEGPHPGSLYLALPAHREVEQTFRVIADNPFGIAVTLQHPVDDDDGEEPEDVSG